MVLRLPRLMFASPATACLHSDQTRPCCSFGRVRVLTKGFKLDGDYDAAGVEKKGKPFRGHMPFARVAEWVDRNADCIIDFLLSCN